MALALVSQPASAARSGFIELDDLACDRSARGIVRVQGLGYAVSHVVRRVKAAGRPCFVVSSSRASLSSELSVRLGLRTSEPRTVGEALASMSACVIVLTPSPVDLDYLHEVGDVGTALCLVEADDAECRVLSALDDADARRVIAGLALADVASVSHRDLASIERWWSAGVPADLDAPPALVLAADRGAWAVLSAAGRAWPLASLGAVTTRSTLARLEAAGVVGIEGAAVRVLVPSDDHHDARALAEALATVFSGDALAASRAAELWASLGDVARAEVLLVEALSLCDCVGVRSRVWESFDRVVSHLPDALAQGFSQRAAELALSLGDPDVAWRWATRLLESGGEGGGAHLALGRALLANGDLRAATVALRESGARASNPRERGRALAYLAEASYLSGALDDARSQAEDASRVADAALIASNTLGKLLLAAGSFGEAEAHFIKDAFDARQAGDRSAELRARVNRAVAVLSDGRADEARALLECVLEEGKATRDHRAIAFALSNLAVLATNRREYEQALSLSEAALVARRKLGERVGLARLVANLAELRLRVGLVREAEQVLAFGRATPKAGGIAPTLAHLAMVSARVHLERGDVARARRELFPALDPRAGSSDGDLLGEANRVGVRVELEDGDLAAAERHLADAKERASAPYACAEVALLELAVARARGDADTELAERAVSLCRDAKHGELTEEAHALASAVYLAAGDASGAAFHAGRARAAIDDVVELLPDSLKGSFTSRRSIQHLLSLLEAAKVPLDSAPPTPRAPRAASAKMHGAHPKMRALTEAVRKVGRSDVTVLIQGESGTGKELVAEAIHAASARRDASLVKVNCGALVESLLLSELFGHEKGAFTGAMTRRRGRFEVAEGGTLFLDEIGDITPATQVALLRVLQERTFERVGGASPIKANVRVICATHRDLRAMVERGTFREDLYFRLSGLVLRVPALRDRLSDLHLIANELLSRIGDERHEAPKSLDDGAIALLERHRWPGNVRELENALRAASLFADGMVISAADLTAHAETLRNVVVEVEPVVTEVVDEDSEEGAAAGNAEAVSLVYNDMKAGHFGLFEAKRHLERECILRALNETKGNITRAATLLGMKRPRLSQLVKQYGLGHASEGSS